MSESLTIELFNRQQARADMQTRLFPFLALALQAGRRWVLTVRPETRTEAQNRLMWPQLQAFADQMVWPVNGRMEKLTPEEWKDLLTAAFNSETMRLAMGLNGGTVMLGQRTSKFSKKRFSEFVEFLYATAADRGVMLPAWKDEE
jgi:hypothetical protein